MDDYFALAKQAINRGFIESTFFTPGAKWIGNRYETRSPLRPQNKIHSFKIEDKGAGVYVYYDHATQDGGDIIDLYAKMQSVKPLEAARMIAGLPRKEGKARPESAEVFTFGFAPEDQAPTFYGATHVWEYRERDNQIAYYVARSETPTGKKFTPAYWDGTKYVYKMPRNYKERRLLLRLPELLDTELPILITEGEKAASVNVPGYFVTSWHGGSAAAKYADCSPLLGRHVILLPDRDEPGKKAMDGIAAKLSGAASLKIATVDYAKNDGRDIADMDSQEIEALIASARPFAELALEAARIKATYGLHDQGNAERLYRDWNTEARWNVDQGKWHIYKNGLWRIDDLGAMRRMAVRTIKWIADEAQEAEDDAKKFIAKHAHVSQNLSRIKAAIEGFQVMEDISLHEVAFDRSPDLIPALNGVIDLQTGELKPHDKDYLFSRGLPVNYNTGAKCPRFLEFLARIFANNLDVVPWLQSFFGYALTGHTSAHLFPIFLGTGANGKSTLIEIVSAVLDEFYAPVRADSLMISKHGDNGRADLATLRGKRLVVASESDDGARLSTSTVKEITGGDEIACRFLYGQFFKYRPTWKIILVTNHRPRVTEQDEGIWRRFRQIPFAVTIPEAERDPNLARNIIDNELEGVLAWMVRGAIVWYSANRKISDTDSIRQYTQEYREAEDMIGRFIGDRCILGVSNEVKAEGIYKAYKEWTQDEGEYTLSANKFGRALTERGIGRRTSGVRIYTGISLRPSE